MAATLAAAATTVAARAEPDVVGLDLDDLALAGAIRRFFSITIPQLRPTLIFVIITATIGGLQIFDEPKLFDQYGTGGANSQWLTLTIYLYNLGWGQLNFGRAAAVAWLLFLVIVLIGLVNLGITRRIASNEGRNS